MAGPQLVTRGQAVSRRAISDGKISKVVDYFGGAAQFGGAQAYLLEQRNYVTRPHFHPADQFQVLYGAPGAMFGRHPVGDLVVHYADANTVYGPLVSADPPLRYFTLRAEPTNATEYMPESRALLSGRGGRSLHRELDPLSPSTLLHDERDGLDVSYLTAAAGTDVDIPAAGPNGQFFFVVTGTIESAGVSYPAESIGWQPPGSPNWAAPAGADGVGVLVLRYPLRSDGASHGQ